jgi:hypothetical protein
MPRTSEPGKGRSRGRAGAGTKPGGSPVTGTGTGSGVASGDTPNGNTIERASLHPVTRPQPPVPQVLEVPATATEIQPEDRREAIARAAYYRAEKRGFVPGHEKEDWLEAERELLAAERQLLR